MIARSVGSIMAANLKWVFPRPVKTGVPFCAYWIMEDERDAGEVLII
jgi:hypothetical protein